MKIYHIYANKTNVGDLLSALAIKKFLKLNSTDLFWTNGYFERTVKDLCNLNEKDVVIIGGGGLLKDYFFRLWETLIGNYKGNKMFLWGVGECINKDDKYTGLPDDMIDSIAKITTKIYVRDFSTKDRFSRIGKEAEIVGCPSTNIARTWSKKSDKYLLHVVHPQLLKQTLPYWRSNAQKLASGLGLKYVEIDHIIPSNHIRGYIYWNSLRNYYENAGLIISSRLHGVILGSARRVPVVPISNDYKIEAYWRGTLGGKKLLNINDSDLLSDFVRAENYDDPDLIQNGVDNVIKSNSQASSEILRLLEYSHI